ncbi:MAG: PIN domain-containing protein [Candidatus Daviesbacteria bacterium]|nr:PIN domain-containing protein [Candidatus Daviesbacteria bacterium]
MKRIVLDTNILIDNVHGFAKWVDDFLKREEIQLVVPTIVVAEYLTAQEAETKTGYESSKSYLATFKIYDLTGEIAEILGRILRRKSYVLGASLADLIVAATAIYLDAELATGNKKDFSKIPDLKFFIPAVIND